MAKNFLAFDNPPHPAPWELPVTFFPIGTVMLTMTTEKLQKNALVLNNAFLRTILENQAVIIAKLKNLPLEDVIKQMNENINNKQWLAEKYFKENIPDYPQIHHHIYQ